MRSKVVRGSYLYDKEILNKQTIKILPLCAFPLGRLRLFRYAGIILAFPFGESGKPLRADRGQSEILPLIPPSPWAGFACFITDCLLSFTFSVFAFDIGFPLGGFLAKQGGEEKISFLFCLKNRPAKFFSNKGPVCKRTTAQKRPARQSIAPVYQALSPLFMVNGTGIYHKRPVHLFAQHHTHQLMRQSHIRKRKLKIRLPFHLRRQPARRAD